MTKTSNLKRNTITDDNGETLVLVGWWFNDEQPRPYNRGSLLVWEGEDYTPNGYVPAPAPVGGDTVSYGYLGLSNAEWWVGVARTGVQATHITVQGTTWGEYCGTTYTRSNARSLVRDFPDTFVTVTGDYSSEFLVLPLDAYIPEHLAEALVELADQYPVYDESDMSELEFEIESECWELYGRSDFLSEVNNALPEDSEVDVYSLTDSEVDDWVAQAKQDDIVGCPEFEGAVSCYWPGLVDAAKAYAKDLTRSNA